MKANVLFVISMICVPFFLSSVSLSLAEDYPTKPITLLVGAAAGSSTDLTARKLADLARKYLNNQAVVVEARGGAPTIAASLVSTAKPDGYTIGNAGGSVMVIMPQLRKIPYDGRKDFEYIIQAAEYLQAFCVRKDHPANSWKEWIEWAKKNVDKATYATMGAGSGQHIGMEAIFLREKINAVHIPFAGPELVSALLGGHVNATMDVNYFSHRETGQMKVFALARKERTTYLPGVPTFYELGYTEVDFPVWWGLIAPAKTPPLILKKLEEAFAKAVNEPEFGEMLLTFGMVPCFKDGSALKKTVEVQYNYYGKLIKQLGLRGD